MASDMQTYKADLEVAIKINIWPQQVTRPHILHAAHCTQGRQWPASLLEYQTSESHLFSILATLPFLHLAKDVATACCHRLLPVAIAYCHCLLPSPIAIACCHLLLPVAIVYCHCLGGWRRAMLMGSWVGGGVPCLRV